MISNSSVTGVPNSLHDLWPGTLEQARLPDAKVHAVLDHIREGCGTRATSRLVKVDKNTVTRSIAKAGAHAEPLHRELVAVSPRDA